MAFLLAAQTVFSASEAARCQPLAPKAPAHDAFTRLLTREPPDTAALWQEAAPFVRRREGFLVLDDSTLDKPYAKKMALVTRHWSGKHKRVVRGINLQTLVWTGYGEADVPCVIPCDVRIYEAGAATKNEQFREMLAMASERDFAPECVLFDAWYSGLDNLKAIKALGWSFLTRLRSNRLVNPEGAGLVAVSEVEVGAGGRVVQLKGYGRVRLFRTVSRDGDGEYWATNDLAMTELRRAELSGRAWGIEAYHRTLKQYCGAEKSAARSAEGQGNHLLFSVRTYLRLEVHRVRAGVSAHEAKARVVREAIRSFLADPYLLDLSTA
jgi:hypothetical protein